MGVTIVTAIMAVIVATITVTGVDPNYSSGHATVPKSASPYT